jgi:hypothetical protein
MQAINVSTPLGWQTIEEALPAGWRELATECGLFVRKLPPHLGAKVEDIGVALRLALYQVATNSGLETTTAAFAAAGVVDISLVALHKWMKKLGPYLQKLLGRMVSGEHAVFAPELWAGYEVVVTDATCVERPGAKGTTARLHYALRLTDLRAVEAHITDHTGGETLRNFQPESCQLWICDRGYSNAPSVAHATKREAAVLIRLNRWSLPLYDIHGTVVDVRRKLERLGKPGRVREWKVRVHADEEEVIEGRLVAVRLPRDKAAEARKRVRDEHGAKTSEEQLWMAEFVVLFTTVPTSRLTAEQLVELYRLRWQVELEFKRAKSLLGLDRLPNFLTETIISWIAAKMLLHQILRAVAARSSFDAFPPSAIGQALLAPQSRAA